MPDESRFDEDKRKIMAVLQDHQTHESLEFAGLGCEDVRGAMMSLTKEGKRISQETSGVAGFRYRLTEEEAAPLQ